MKILRRKLKNAHVSWRAVVTLWHEEISFRIQAIAGLVVFVLSYVLGITKTEFLIVVLTVGSVLAVEALNTAIEELCDHVTPSEHPKIGKIKDLGSGASLLIGIAALIVGCVIFIPPILGLL